MNMLVINLFILLRIEFFNYYLFLNYFKEKKKRKCNDSYVQLSFTCTETTEGLQKPQRIFFRNIVFSNRIIQVARTL